MSDYDRFDDVRLEPTPDGGEEIVIPRWPDDDVPALLRAVADAWEAGNLRDYERTEPCEHWWLPPVVAGFRSTCITCGAVR